MAHGGESPTQRLVEALKERLNTRRLEREQGSSAGGCISRGLVYTADNDVRIFVKTNGQATAKVMFDGELESLRRMLATRTVRAPQPLAVVHNYDGQGSSALAMECLNLCTLSAGPARQLGQRLADMHDYNNKVMRFNERASRWIGGRPPSAAPSGAHKDKAAEEEEEEEENEEEEANQFAKHSLRVQNLSIHDDQPSASTGAHDGQQFAQRFVPHPGAEDAVEKFGFEIPTSCGSIPQVNEWTDDWVAFYARHRLDKAIRSLLAEHGDRTLHELWSQLQLKVGKFFTDLDTIVPALLHGDLWSGNLAQLADDAPVGVVYDPASFYGHNEYEFGIVKLFGGVCKEFFQGYHEVIAKNKLTDRRVELYELFHLLNHWDHFGLGYRQQSINSMKNLLRYC